MSKYISFTKMESRVNLYFSGGISLKIPGCVNYFDNIKCLIKHYKRYNDATYNVIS